MNLAPPLMLAMETLSIMSGLSLEIVCCNDRGLNSPAKRKALREFADSLHAAIFCIQETKLAVIDQYTIMECFGSSYDGFVYLPACETKGGVIITWNSSMLQISNLVNDTNFIMGYVSPSEGGLQTPRGSGEDAVPGGALGSPPALPWPMLGVRVF